MTEHDGENDERKQGHAEDQKQRHAIVEQPLALAARHQQKPRF